MQQSQFNFARPGTKLRLAAVMLLLAFPAQAGKPDPLLDGGPTTTCAAGTDYVAGMDATGQPVVPADVGQGRIPVPNSIAIPLARQGGRLRPGMGDSAYINLDGQKLDPLVNPPPCR